MTYNKSLLFYESFLTPYSLSILSYISSSVNSGNGFSFISKNKFRFTSTEVMSKSPIFNLSLLFPGIAVDKQRFGFGIDDFLTGIDTVIAGQAIADGGNNEEKRQPLQSEQFQG